MFAWFQVRHAYDAGMTAAFDATGAATGGVDQRFTDALSGSDGTGDPSVLMPVLDVYPGCAVRSDAGRSGAGRTAVARVDPARRAASAPTSGRRSGRQDREQDSGSRAPAPDSTQPGQRQPAQRRPAGRRPAGGQPAPRQPGQDRPVGNQPRAQSGPPSVNWLRSGRSPGRAGPADRRAPAQPRSGQLQRGKGRTVTAADVGARCSATCMSGQSEQVDRQSFQATHPQSMGSTAPSAVAPAAPMASQYSGAGQARNTARDQAQERRRTSERGPRKGVQRLGRHRLPRRHRVRHRRWVQKVIDLINELFEPVNRKREPNSVAVLLRIPVFRRLWSAIAISSLGDWLGPAGHHRAGRVPDQGLVQPRAGRRGVRGAADPAAARPDPRADRRRAGGPVRPAHGGHRRRQPGRPAVRVDHLSAATCCGCWSRSSWSRRSACSPPRPSRPCG